MKKNGVRNKANLHQVETDVLIERVQNDISQSSVVPGTMDKQQFDEVSELVGPVTQQSDA